MQKRILSALRKIVVADKWMDEATWEGCKLAIERIKKLASEYKTQLNNREWADLFYTNDEINDEIKELVKEAGKNETFNDEIKRILTPVLDEININWTLVYDYVQSIIFHRRMEMICWFDNNRAKYQSEKDIEDSPERQYHKNKEEEYLNKLKKELKLSKFISHTILDLYNVYEDELNRWIEKFKNEKYLGKDLPRKLKLKFTDKVDPLHLLKGRY